MATLIAHTELQLGDVVLPRYWTDRAITAEILRGVEESPDPYLPGRHWFRYWARSNDGREGYLSFGGGGRVWRR